MTKDQEEIMIQILKNQESIMDVLYGADCVHFAYSLKDRMEETRYVLSELPVERKAKRD